MINVEYYTDVDERLEVPVILPPALNLVDLTNARVLVVDDVADTGETLLLVADQVRRHVADVRTAVLYEKPLAARCDYVWRRTTRVGSTSRGLRRARRPRSPTPIAEGPGSPAPRTRLGPFLLPGYRLASASAASQSITTALGSDPIFTGTLEPGKRKGSAFGVSGSRPGSGTDPCLGA